MLTHSELIQFRIELLAWFERCKRDLPWRRTRDPYAIWISEAMLQQTRVAAVLPYYERFLQRFPNARALADTPEADLLSAWAGLGYYYRARNLQKAARQICDNGPFPNSYTQLRSLPGIGDYTAAAVSSIAFNLPHAVLDGNVFRVLSRLFADSTDIGTIAARKHFLNLAATLLDTEQPGAFNQAMMELGATVCLTRNPQCLLCPISDVCRARQAGIPEQFPVNSSRQKSLRENRTLFWIERDDHLLAWQRPADSRLMPGFWELPERRQVGDLRQLATIGSFRHGITFHDYAFEIIEAEPPAQIGLCHWLPLARLETYPTSTILRKAAKRVSKYRNCAVQVKAAKGGKPG